MEKWESKRIAQTQETKFIKRLRNSRIKVIEEIIRDDSKAKSLGY